MEAGYSIHPAVFSERELETLAAALAEVHRSRAGARHLMGIPAVAAAASDPCLLALARDVLGPSAVPYRATLFEKSAGANWLVVWHQDTALPLRSRVDRPGSGPWSTKGGIIYAHAPASALERVVALRLHLDASTPSNGPLRVIPGSHTQGVLSDEALQDLARSHPCEDCLVGAGGVLRMSPLIVHSSSKARTPAPRRVLHLEYASSFQVERDLELDVA